MARGKHRTRKELRAMIGKKFGKWTVTHHVRVNGSSQIFKAKCECGTVKEIPEFNLRTGHSTQCEFCRNEAQRKRFPTYSRYYRIWSRVNGIGCVDEWRDIAKFWEYVGTTIPPHKEFVRIDNSKPFGPDNYRWGRADRTKAKRNELNGEQKTVRELQEALGVSRQRVHQILLLAAGRCQMCGNKREREDRQKCDACREKLRIKNRSTRNNRTRDWKAIIEEAKAALNNGE